MPVILLTVPETIQSVLRPVVTEITRSIFQSTGINEKTPIYYPDDLDVMRQPGSSISDLGPGINTYPSQGRMNIVVQEEYEVDRLLSTAYMRPENFFIFRDDLLETYIKPAYSSQDVKINFVYRTVDKVQAERWRDDMRSRVSMNEGAQVKIHTVSYHYLIPTEFLYVLREIHRLRENVAAYGDSYEEYLREKIEPKATIVTTMVGTEPAWAMPETQMRIVGTYDFEGGPPLEEKEDGVTVYTIGFTYKFKFDKPIACIMGYPLMIHNQMLSVKFRPEKPPYYLDDYYKAFTLSAKMFNYFEKGKTKLKTLPGVAIPTYDEFIPKYVMPDTKRIMTMLVAMDVNNPTELMSFNDLTTYKLSQTILDFMVIEAPYMTTPGASIFCLSAYRNHDLMDPNTLTIDNTLTVHSTSILAFRDYHHVRLSVVTDLRTLNSAAVTRCIQNGAALNLLLQYIDFTITKAGLLPKIIGAAQNIPGLNPNRHPFIPNEANGRNGIAKANAANYRPRVIPATTAASLNYVTLQDFNAAADYINRKKGLLANPLNPLNSVYFNVENLVIQAIEANVAAAGG